MRPASAIALGVLAAIYYNRMLAAPRLAKDEIWFIYIYSVEERGGSALLLRRVSEVHAY